MSIFNKISLFFQTAEDKRSNENTLLESFKSAQKKIDAFIELTKPITVKRRQTFNSLMSFVLDNEQWSQAEINDLDGDMDLTFNFSEDYFDRYLARLFPRNPHTGVLEIGVTVDSSQPDHDKLEKIVLDFYKDNEIISVILDQATNYLVAGAGILYYPRDPKTNKVVLINLDPKDCYLGWRGSELVQFAYREFVGDNKYDIFYWDLFEFLHFDARANKYFQEKNEFNFIPASWIPNKPKPHKHEGRPKTLALYNLDRAYNFSATDYAHRVADNTEPPIVLKSDSVDTKSIERGRKKMTKIGQGDSMEYLELKEGKEILSFLDLLENRIKAKSGVVDSAGAVKSGISGVSLSFQYSDMMDLIGFMRVAWDIAFRRMNKAVLSYQFGEKEYKTNPVYHPFINLDNKQRVEEYSIMINDKVISRRDAIDELRGVENPDQKFEEILAEDKKIKVDDSKEKNKDIK